MAVTPTLDILGSIGLRPRISFHSPMLQAFRLDCLATKMLISGRWLTQIEHFRLLVFETMDLMLASPFVKLQIIFPMICQAPVAAFAVYPFAPCGCKRLVHKHRRFLLDPKKNPMGKSHMKFDKKLDQLNKKTG